MNIYYINDDYDPHAILPHVIEGDIIVLNGKVYRIEREITDTCATCDFWTDVRAGGGGGGDSWETSCELPF